MTSGRRVPGEGPPSARIAIVGEAPGESEEMLGRPFVGASGDLLNSMLSQAGIQRQDCYVTNLFKYRPTANNFDLLYLDGKKRRQPSPALLTAVEELQAELAGVSPNVVIPMGNEPLRYLLGKDGILNWSGSIVPSRWGKCIPCVHPAFILRQYPYRALAVAYLKRAARESLTREYRSPQLVFESSPSFERAMQLLGRVRGGARVAFDIETLGEHGEIRSLGLCSEESFAFCIPFMCNKQEFSLVDGQIQQGHGSGNSFWTVEQEHALLGEVWRIFQDPTIEKIAHNYGFDAPLLEREFGIQCRGFFMDTLLAQHTCFPELPKDLGTCSSMYTEIPCYWDTDHKNDQSDRLYNCYDALVTWRISYVLERQLQAMGLEGFYRKRNRVLVHVSRVMKRGIEIDERFKQANFITTEASIQKTERLVRERAGDPLLNLKSPKQMSYFLYTKLGMSEQYSRKSGDITTDKDAIVRLIKLYPEHSEILVPLAVHRSLCSLNDKFLGVPSPPDRKFRTQLNAAGTVNGRLSSSDPLFEYGTNLQNIKRGEFRRMFKARDGWLMIKADLAQAEFRWVVWKARITSIIEKYSVNPFYDVYRMVAAMIFNVSEEGVTKEQRYLGKVTALAANYDMQAGTMAAINGIPFNQAKFALGRYHEIFPEIGFWWAQVRDQVGRTRQITNSYGRVRTFMERLGPSLYRDAYNCEPQGFVADHVNEALCEVEESWPEDQAHILTQVHDELLCQAREEVAQKYALDLKVKMERPVLIWPDLPPMVIPAEVGVGPNWYDQKGIGQ